MVASAGWAVLAALLTAASCTHEAVFVSKSTQIGSADNLNQLLSGATHDCPVLLSLVGKFNLAKFSRYMDVYNNDKSSFSDGRLQAYVRSSVSAVSRTVEQLSIPTDACWLKDSLCDGRAVWVAAADDISDLSLSDSVGKLPHCGSLVLLDSAVLKASRAVRRRSKRAADSASGAIHIPSAQMTTTVNCSFVVGAVSVVFVPKGGGSSIATVDASNYTVTASFDCGAVVPKLPGVLTSNFSITYAAADAPGDTVLKTLKLTVTFKSTLTGYWNLNGISADELDGKFGGKGVAWTEPKLAKRSSLNSLAVSSVRAYSFACQQLSTVWIDAPPKTGGRVGLRFDFIQWQPFGGNGSFVGQVDDCVPLLHIGTWMGVVAMIVLLGVFFFGLCMLVNIDTMERFDDPKSKPLQVAQAD